MRRREFISLLGYGIFTPSVARAQQSEKVWRIGYFRTAPPPEGELQALLRALSAQGYTQGRHFVLVSRFGDGNVSRISELAIALVNDGVDIIVTEGVIPVRTARAVTATIPIVMAASADPFLGGLIQNLSRPGGNITGFTAMSVDIAGKAMEILKQLVPALSRVAMISPRVVWDIFVPPQGEAAKALGLEISYIDISSTEAIEPAFRQASSSGVQGILLRGSPFFSSMQRRLIVESAAAQRMPVMFERREYVEQGGLASYAADSRDLHRRAGEYVARIMGGAKAGDLPIQQPSKFELVLNLKTAKALGLTVPATLLATANEVIE